MCGIFGAVRRTRDSQENIAKVCFTGLFQLQHRGRESAGISVSCDGQILTHKGMGTIDWVFREQIARTDLVQFSMDHPDKKKLIRYIARRKNLSAKDCRALYATKTRRELLGIALEIFEEENTKNPLDALQGIAAIGHIRYSTTGASGAKNAQPIGDKFKGDDFAVALNGNIVNTKKLEEVVLERGGYERSDTTDTGLIVALFATSKKDNFWDALVETVELLEGAFSLLVLYQDIVFALKDRSGVRPLCLGKTENHFLAASESCALANFRAEFLGEVESGTIAILDGRLQVPMRARWISSVSQRGCVFEKIYFSRPDTLGMGGGEVSNDRKAMGREAAREHPIFDADMVSPVLDSGLFACLGYAQELERIFRSKSGQRVPDGGLFDYAFIRGRVDRTFLHPIADERKLLQNLKHSVIPGVVADKHVVVVDDSIVRGNVMPYIVETLRFFGARKVSVIIPSPPLRHPCHLGVDLPLREEYIAHERTVDEIRELIGADYLGYLSLEGMYRALGRPRSEHCDGCLTGEWPVPFPERGEYNPKAQ